MKFLSICNFTQGAWGQDIFVEFGFSTYQYNDLSLLCYLAFVLNFAPVSVK